MQEPLPTSVPVIPPSPRPSVRARDLLLVVALTVALVLLVRFLLRGQVRSAEWIIPLLGVQSAIPLAAVYLVIIRGRGVSWRDLGLRPISPGWVLGAIMLGIATVFAIGFVNYLSQSLAGGAMRNPQIEILAPIAMSWQGLLGLLVMAGVVAPIVEEIVFRGVFYAWLRARWGVAVGAFVSALAFALAHGIPILIPALLAQGVILALVYERSGSLWAPIIIHGVFNAVMSLAMFAALSAGVKFG